MELELVRKLVHCCCCLSKRLLIQTLSTQIVNQTSELRYDYGDPSLGTCEETILGGVSSIPFTPFIE